MIQLCSIPDLGFPNLVGERKVDYGAFLLEAVDLMVTGPPYNIRPVVGAWKSNHDRFPVNDRKAMAIFCRKVMKHVSI